MSERFIIENNDHYWIRDTERAEYISHGVACDRLNRLTAQVATLRELLKDVLLFIRHDADHPEDCPGCVVDARIDSALADTETTG